ncbi:NAC domain-containing protein 41, partial [Linum perenne]
FTPTNSPNSLNSYHLTQHDRNNFIFLQSVHYHFSSFSHHSSPFNFIIFRFWKLAVESRVASRPSRDDLRNGRSQTGQIKMAEQDSSQTLDLPLQKLPPGYRFNPTDEELVSFYLYKHISGFPLQNHSFCPVFFCNLYSFKEPWEIWSECQSQKFGLPIGDVYFITKLKKEEEWFKNRSFCGNLRGLLA